MSAQTQSIFAVRNYLTSDKQPFQLVFHLPDGGSLPQGLAAAVNSQHCLTNDAFTEIGGYDLKECPTEAIARKSLGIVLHGKTYFAWCFDPDDISKGKAVKRR